jgi:hypothetical protein
VKKRKPVSLHLSKPATNGRRQHCSQLAGPPVGQASGVKHMVAIVGYCGDQQSGCLDWAMTSEGFISFVRTLNLSPPAGTMATAFD